MTDLRHLSTDAALIDSIVERGFDPAMPIQRDDFVRLLRDAEAIDREDADALPPAIFGMGRQFGEIGEALTLPVAVGHRWLLRLLDTTPVTLEETAINDSIATLVRRLVPVLQQIVQFEAVVSRSARNLGGDVAEDLKPERPLLDVWLDRWQTFPVLASVMTLTVVQWARVTEEMIRALEHDHVDLATTLTGSTTPLTIHSIHGDAGDPHLGGRSVMILTFGDGARIVFKPKLLAITDVFRKLVDRINSAGYSTPLRVHGAIVRDRHAWEAFVPHRPCDSEAQVERFYRRMGGWIRLLQVVEGRDFWLDNLIADGEYPIFIDLETIMQPRRRGMAMSASAEAVQERMESSPLITNIVAMPVPIGPGIGGEDLACFASPKDFLSPFRATEIPGAKTSGESRSGYRTWTHPEHAPRLDGASVTADKWFSAIEAGYREMAAIIDALSPELLQPGGLVDQLCAHPVRTIFRDTWTCIRIIHRSTAPPLLGHYQRRRQFLERMDRDTSNQALRTGPVIAAEVRAMISLDVPFFSAFGHDEAIHPPEGGPVPDFFDGTAGQRVVANLRTFSREKLEEDVSILRTSFWTTHQGAPVPPTIRTPASAPIGDQAWLNAARRIADDIYAARVAAEDGSCSWLALSYHPTADIEAWSPIGSDLLSGRAGLVTLFIDQWHASGEDRWREIAIESALEIASTTQQVIEPLKTETSGRSSPLLDAPVLLGAFTGIGGMLATMKQVAETFGATEIESIWREILDALDWESTRARSSHDVIGGTIGLGLALTARREWIDQLPDELRTSIANIALGDDVAGGIIHPPDTLRKLAALPGPRVAQLLIRHRLNLEPPEGWRDAIQAILDADPSPGNWLGIIELSGPDSPWWPHLTHDIARTIEMQGTSADRILHIQAAELALAMWHASADTSWRERARAVGQRWISEFNATGSWFPDDLADDRFRLSMVRGLPAIASVMQRIGGASTVASPMTLDWRTWDTR